MPQALAAEVAAPKGLLLLASCSSRITAPEFFKAILEVLNSHPRQFRERGRTYHDIDHPIGFPEGAYLKAIYMQAQR